MTPELPGLWQCPRRVGFLFPHPCVRLTPVGCPDCNNGQVEDPYHSRTDRTGYDDYDSYSSSETSGSSGTPVAFGGGDSGGGGASSSFDDSDFTEADGESLTSSGNDFEDDMSAS